MSMTRPCLDSMCLLNTARAASNAITVALSSAPISREYPGHIGSHDRGEVLL